MAASETLPAIEVSFNSRMTVTPRFNRVQFGDGYSQRSTDGINTITRSWDVVWDGITTTQADTLDAFFVARKGGVEAFLWTDPMSDTQRQYTLSGDLTRRPIGHDTERVTAVFQQEFDL